MFKVKFEVMVNWNDGFEMRLQLWFLLKDFVWFTQYIYG